MVHENSLALSSHANHMRCDSHRHDYAASTLRGSTSLSALSGNDEFRTPVSRGAHPQVTFVRNSRPESVFHATVYGTIGGMAKIGYARVSTTSPERRQSG